MQMQARPAAFTATDELVALLQEHGAATEYRWMGLAATDVMRKQGRRSTVRSSEGMVDRKRTERPVLEGEPGWLDETGQTTDSSGGESTPGRSTASSGPRDSRQTGASL